MNKFKKENNDDGTEDKNEIGIDKIIYFFFKLNLLIVLICLPSHIWFGF